MPDATPEQIVAFMLGGNMSDIVERSQRREIIGLEGEVEYLKAEIERLTAGNAAVDAQFRIWRERAEKAEAEIERLRHDNMRLQTARDYAFDPREGELSKQNREIERLTAALQRIDGINDNPACFNPMIEEVLRRALEPRP